MSSELPVVYDTKQIDTDVYRFNRGLKLYLDYLDLPTENVLVEVKERGKVVYNLPTIVDDLTDEHREKALYISKFVASCGAGLFDAALNYLWNETILNLRKKVIQFDLEYFYDSTITNPDKRGKFRNEDDLEKLEDWDLIRGCREIGILSEIGYKHLDHIRDMRNFASAAHPNQNQITGLQLVAWLETCIKEVLAVETTGPLMEVKKLLYNIRNETLSQDDVKPIKTLIKKAPKDFVNSLLRALFGMYTDEDTQINIRNNIDLIAKAVWDESDEEAKHTIGLKYTTFSANAEIRRKELANQFLSIVDGLAYLTEDMRALEMKNRLELLLAAHYAYNNFYNEEPHAKILLKYIPKSGKIPDPVRQYYVKVLTICRLGNSWGISRLAMPYYDQMLSMFGKKEIICFLKLLKDKEVTPIFEDNRRIAIFKNLAKELKKRTTNEIWKQALEIVEDSSNSNVRSGRIYLEIKKLVKSQRD